MPSTTKTISSTPTVTSTLTPSSPLESTQPTPTPTIASRGDFIDHQPVTDAVIQDSSQQLKAIGCDDDAGNDKCQVGSIEYQITKDDSEKLTVISVPVRGSDEAQWGWISIPANTLKPGCVVKVSQGSVPQSSGISGAEDSSSGCSDNEGDEGESSRVSPSISIKTYCNGKKVSLFQNDIKLQFIANLDEKDEKKGKPCFGYFEEEKDQKSWKCLKLKQATRINSRQVLYTASTKHFTRYCIQFSQLGWVCR